MRANIIIDPETHPLFLANQSLVRNLVRRYYYNLYGTRFVPQEDLINAGLHGLIQAIKDFDPFRGHRFEAFATRVIRRRIVEEIRRWGGEKERNKFNKPTSIPLSLHEHWREKGELQDVLDDPQSDKPVDETILHLDLQRLLSALEPRHRDFLTGYFLERDEVREKGISQAVHDGRRDRALKAARKIVNELGLKPSDFIDQPLKGS